MIPLLRKEFGKLHTIDPDSPAYARLCAILDKASDDALKAAHRANIKFVSALAFNRLIKRGVKF